MVSLATISSAVSCQRASAQTQPRPLAAAAVPSATGSPMTSIAEKPPEKPLCIALDKSSYDIGPLDPKLPTVPIGVHRR